MPVQMAQFKAYEGQKYSECAHLWVWGIEPKIQGLKVRAYIVLWASSHPIVFCEEEVGGLHVSVHYGRIHEVVQAAQPTCGAHRNAGTFRPREGILGSLIIQQRPH